MNINTLKSIKNKQEKEMAHIFPPLCNRCPSNTLKGLMTNGIIIPYCIFHFNELIRVKRIRYEVYAGEGRPFYVPVICCRNHQNVNIWQRDQEEIEKEKKEQTKNKKNG